MNKQEKILNKISLKIIFQQLLLISSFIAFTVLIILSYTNSNKFLGVNDLDGRVNLRLMRALFPVFMTWYVFSFIWSIKNGIDLILNEKIKLQGILLIFSFIPIFSIINIFYYFSKVNKEVVNYYVNLLFKQDKELMQIYKWGSWRRNLLLFVLIVLSPVAVFIFLGDGIKEQDFEKNIWFFSLNYFTIQTNLMILFFTLISFLFPGLKIFKNNNLQITVTVYIFVVGFAWNTMLLPELFKNGKAKEMTNTMWAITCWYHIVDPLVFIISSCILIFKNPFKTVTTFKKIFCLALPYPLMYLTFVGIVPFTAGISIYGVFTNVNPQLNIDNTFGDYANFAIIIGFWFIFLFLVWLVWFLDKRINSSKIINNNKNNSLEKEGLQNVK